MKTNHHLLSASCAAALAVFASQSDASAQVFSENFNDLNAGSRWSFAVQTEATADPSTGPDGLVNFAFDYSTLGIANPRGGADTIGAAVGVNLTDQTGDEGETYIIFPTGLSLSGPFSARADMFVYNDGGSGSTELGVAGAFLNNSDPVAPYQWGSRGGSLAWLYSGEGGTTADIATFEEGGPSSTGYSPISDYNNIPADSIPGFQTGVSGSLGPAGSNPRGSWVEVLLESDGNTVNYYLNGALVDSYDNTGDFYSDGNVFWGLTDPFNSANSGNRMILDNVVVSVPEPSTLALGLFGSTVGLWLMKRRK